MELLKLPNVRMHEKTQLDETQLHGDSKRLAWEIATKNPLWTICLLYTSPSPRDRTRSRMPSSA